MTTAEKLNQLESLPQGDEAIFEAVPALLRLARAVGRHLDAERGCWDVALADALDALNE